MDKKKYLEIENLALKGETKTAWESLMETYDVKVGNKDFFYHTADFGNSRHPFVTDVVPPLFNRVEDTDAHKLLGTLSACANALNYNNHADVGQLKYQLHKNVNLLSAMEDNVSAENKHLLYSQLATISKDAGNIKGYEEFLDKALDNAPSRAEALKYASSLQLSFRGIGEKEEAAKTKQAYSKVLVLPNTEGEKEASYWAHLNLARADKTLIKYENNPELRKEGATHFEEALSLASNLSDKIDVLDDYQHLYDSGTKEREEIYSRYDTLKKCQDLSKKIKKEQMPPRKSSQPKDFSLMKFGISRN